MSNRPSSKQTSIDHHFMIFGPTGSGKTSHGAMFAAMLLRRLVDMSYVMKVGKAYNPGIAQDLACSDKGELVRDDVVMQQLDTYLQTCRRGERLVIVGVPRKETQVPRFYEILEKNVGPTSIVVADLIMPREMVLRRCQERAARDLAGGVTPRPEDVNPEIILGRIELHDKEKRPVLDALASRGARIAEVICAEHQQNTLINVIQGFRISTDDLFFKPAGLELAEQLRPA